MTSLPLRAHRAVLLASLVALPMVASSASTANSTDRPLPAVGACSHGVMSGEGSAALMYNLAEHPKSIRVQARNMLAGAVGKASSGQEVVFTVSPKKDLPADKQPRMCALSAEKTRSAPLLYGPEHFTDVRGMDNWITEFTQGHGEAGKRLYAECDGDCDPSYTFVITPGKAGYALRAEVFCGLVRDRSDEDPFRLETALRAPCGSGATN